MKQWERDLERMLTEPPEPAVFCGCLWCKDDIYVGQWCIKTADGYLHDECLDEYVAETIVEKTGTAGEEIC